MTCMLTLKKSMWHTLEIGSICKIDGKRKLEYDEITYYIFEMGKTYQLGRDKLPIPSRRTGLTIQA